MQSPIYFRSSRVSKWKKPLSFGLCAAVGALLFAGLGEVWLAATAPAPPPPPPPPPPAPPQAVVLVLDTSGSMEGNALREMKDAAKAYIGRQNMTTSRIGIVNFDSQSHIVSSLSRDAGALNLALDNLSTDGSTRMDLGLDTGILLLPSAPAAPVNAPNSVASERRNILLFTDGYPDPESEDGDPVARTLAAAAGARQNGIRIVAVGTSGADAEFLAKVTGDPRLVFSASDGQFGEAFKRAEIALAGPTGRAMIQSAKVENFDAGLELLRTSVWTGLLGLGIAGALLLSQNFYGRGRLGARQLWGAGAGLVAGLVAGALGQWMFLQAGNDALSLALGRLLAWAMGGALLGIGIAPFVPNLSIWRAGLGGALGGWIGAMGFIALSSAAGDVAGRVSGAAAIGFAIGLMVVLAEVAFRRAYLRVSYGPNDAFDLSLGAQIVAVGSDHAQCRIYARETAPVVARYGWEGDQAFLIDRQDTRHALQVGDTRRFGNVEITLCSEAAEGASKVAPLRPSLQPGARQSAFKGFGARDAVAAANSLAAPLIAAGRGAAAPKSAIWRLQGAQTFEVRAGASAQLGRAAGNDIVISEMSISSRHAILTASDGALSICDLGSTNGTFVNGQRLAPEIPTPLADGDQVRLGALDFVVRSA